MPRPPQRVSATDRGPILEHFYLSADGSVREAFFDARGALNVVLNFAPYVCTFDAKDRPILDALYAAVRKEARQRAQFELVGGGRGRLDLGACFVRVSELDGGRAVCEVEVEGVLKAFCIRLRRTEGREGVQARIRAAFEDVWERSSEAVTRLNQTYSALARDEDAALQAQKTPVPRNRAHLRADRDAVRGLLRLTLGRLEREGCVAHDGDDAFSPARRAAMRKRFVFAGMGFVYHRLSDAVRVLFSGGPMFADPVMDAFINVVNARWVGTVDDVVGFTVDPSPLCVKIEFLVPSSGV